MKVFNHDFEFTKFLLNKMLEKYKLDVDYILKHQDEIKQEHGKPWYSYYTFETEEEFEDWKRFCIKAMMTQLNPKMSEERAELEFSFLNLNFGLRQAYKCPRKFI